MKRDLQGFWRSCRSKPLRLLVRAGFALLDSACVFDSQRSFDYGGTALGCDLSPNRGEISKKSVIRTPGRECYEQKNVSCPAAKVGGDSGTIELSGQFL